MNLAFGLGNSLGQFLKAPRSSLIHTGHPFPASRRLHKSMTIKAFLQLMRLFLFITFSRLSSIDWLRLAGFLGQSLTADGVILLFSWPYRY